MHLPSRQSYTIDYIVCLTYVAGTAVDARPVEGSQCAQRECYVVDVLDVAAFFFSFFLSLSAYEST